MKGRIIGYDGEQSKPIITIELKIKEGIIPIGQEVEVTW